MREVTIAEYMDEFEKIGVGDRLYYLITDIAARMVPNYPPHLYPPFYQEWDENSIREVAHEFIMQWLLESGRLEYHLYSQPDSNRFEELIRGELRRFMINNRRATEFGNLFRRTKLLLRSDDQFHFFELPDRNDILWGLSEWADQDFDIATFEEVLAVMWKLTIPPLIKYRTDSKKISHLISDNTLKLVLVTSLTKLEKRIELKEFMNALRYRLGIVNITEQSFDQIISDSNTTLGEILPAQITAVEKQIVVDEVADDIFDMLTDRQRKILSHYLASSKGTLQEVAEKIDVSKSTIHNELKHIEQSISSRVQESEGELVFARLAELCFQNIGDDQNSED